MVSSLRRNMVKKWHAARSSRNSSPKKKTRTSSKRGRNEATQPMSFLVPSNLIVRSSVKTDIIFQAFTHPTTWNRKEYSHWKITLFRILYWISRNKRIQQKIGGCELHIPFWRKLPGALPAFIYRAVLHAYSAVAYSYSSSTSMAAGVSPRIGQLGLRCFEDGAVLVYENGYFFLALFSSPGQSLALTWTLRLSSFLSPPWPPSRPASQALWGALFLLPRWPSARALIWRQFANEKPKIGCWRLHRSGWLSGGLFLSPLATRRFHDPQLELLACNLPPLPPGCILSWATFWICLQTRPWCRTELLCRCLSRGVITIFCFAMPSGYWGVWIEISLQQFLWQCMTRVWFPKGSP